MIDSIIEETAAAINKGKTILYPTDTIWGLGCDATNPAAVEKIYNLKERQKEKPFLILVDSIEMLKNYVEDLHPRIETLLFYHTKPLTIIYKKSRNLPSISVANDSSIGIRITLDEFCRSIIKLSGKPLISTSANIGNEPPPSFFNEVSERVKEGVDYIVNYKQDSREMKAPSVIVTYDEMGELQVLRS